MSDNKDVDMSELPGLVDIDEPGFEDIDESGLEDIDMVNVYVPIPSPVPPPGRRRRRQPPKERVVPAGGWFMGAVGSLRLQQTAADIYLQRNSDPAFDEEGTRRRVATCVLLWGVTFAYVQATVAPGPVLQQVWVADGNAAGWLLTAVDLGQTHLHRWDVPIVIPAIVPALLGGYFVEGDLVVGWRLSWHHVVEIRRTNKDGGPLDLHYHEHERRRHRQLEPPALKDDGKYWLFRYIRYATQVQNYRKAIGKPKNAAGGVAGDSGDSDDDAGRGGGGSKKGRGKGRGKGASGRARGKGASGRGKGGASGRGKGGASSRA